MEEEDHKKVMATLRNSGIFGSKMLEKCSALLMENDIDEECLLMMTKDELNEVFTFGIKKKIMKWQVSVRGEPEPVVKLRVKPPPQLQGKRVPPPPVLLKPSKSKQKMSPAPELVAKRFPPPLALSKSRKESPAQIRKKCDPKCLPLGLPKANGFKEKPRPPLQLIDSGDPDEVGGGKKAIDKIEKKRLPEVPLSLSGNGLLKPVPQVATEPDINIEEMKIPKKSQERKVESRKDETAEDDGLEKKSAGGRKRRPSEQYEDRTRTKLGRHSSRSRSTRARRQRSRSRERRLDHARRLYKQKKTSEFDIPSTKEESEALIKQLSQDFQVGYAFVEALYKALDEHSRTLFVSGFDYGTTADEADEFLSKILLREDLYEEEANQDEKTFAPDALIAEIESVKSFSAQSFLVFFKSREALRAVERIIKLHGAKLALCATMFRKRQKDLTTEERDADLAMFSYLKRLLRIPNEQSRYTRKWPREDVRWTGKRRSSNSSWDKKPRRSPSDRRRAIPKRKDIEVYPEIIEKGSPRYRRAITRIKDDYPSTRTRRELPIGNHRYRTARRTEARSLERMILSAEKKLIGHERYIRRNRSPRSRSRSRGGSSRKNKGHSHRPNSRQKKLKNNSKILRCSVCEEDFMGSYDFNKHLDDYDHRKDKEFY